MASAEHEPVTGVWGQSPQRGPGAEPLVRGSGGRSPPEAESILVIGCLTEPANLAPVRENTMFCYGPLVSELGGPRVHGAPQPQLKMSVADCLHTALQKILNGSRCRLGCGLGWARGCQEPWWEARMPDGVGHF